MHELDYYFSTDNLHSNDTNNLSRGYKKVKFLN